MQKKYLILSGTTEKGPFTIGELWQQQLSPRDMIWIEGESTAWTYLSELELSSTQVKLPARTEEQTLTSGDEIEKKAEMLRQRALSYHSNSSGPMKIATIRREQEAVAAKDTEVEFVDHRVSKPSVWGDVAMTVVILGIFVVGILGTRSFFAEKKQVATTPITTIQSSDVHAASASSPAISQAPTVDTLTATQGAALEADSTKVVATVPVKKPIRKSKPAPDTLSPAATVSSTQTLLQSETPANDVADKNIAPDTTTSEKDASATAEPEKKKGFLKGLFRKKKKDND